MLDEANYYFPEIEKLLPGDSGLVASQVFFESGLSETIFLSSRGSDKIYLTVVLYWIFCSF